ncbi:hypothetical protein [Ilumatobacter sp.]|uniref:hypothetical protein n=1 Tax=Ilumatobacter sp. TaxID=1967498 RepID=UPI003B51739F
MHDLGELILDGGEVDLGRFEGADTVVLSAAGSARRSITYDEDGAFFDAGTTVDWPMEVVLRNRPASVQRIEVELTGDLVLCLGYTREEWKHPRNRYEDHAVFVHELLLHSAEAHNVALRA